MKQRIAWILAYLALCFGVLTLVLACVSSTQRDEAAKAVRAELDAVLAARGIVMTPAEQERLQTKLVDLERASGFDWPTLGAFVGSAVTAILPILRVIPNRFILGAQEAAALDRATYG